MSALRQIGFKRHRKKLSGKQSRKRIMTLRRRKKREGHEESKPNTPRIDPKDIRAAKKAIDAARLANTEAPNWALQILGPTVSLQASIQTP